MKITKEQIKKLDPCISGWDWYLKNCKGIEDLETLLLKISEKKLSWATWLITTIMEKEECVEIAVFSAKQVLHIFEKEYPNDVRPRKAIESVEKLLKDSNITTYNAARAASRAADAADSRAAFANAVYAAYAADASSRADSSRAAVYAAAAAAYSDAADSRAATSRAAAYAADTAAYAAAYADPGLEVRIIKEAVRILDRRNK